MKIGAGTSAAVLLNGEAASANGVSIGCVGSGGAGTVDTTG